MKTRFDTKLFRRFFDEPLRVFNPLLSVTLSPTPQDHAVIAVLHDPLSVSPIPLPLFERCLEGGSHHADIVRLNDVSEHGLCSFVDS